MKKLIIEVQEVFGSKCMHIKEQTERGEQFGEGRSESFTASNGFGLCSQVQPETSRYNKLYVRGSDNTRDDVMMVVPSEEWLRMLRVAVREYNIRFTDCKMKCECKPGYELIE